MKLLIITFLFLIASSHLWAQDTANIDFAPTTGFILYNVWKYHMGDNPAWANPKFNDNDWQAINPTKDIKDLPPLWKTNIGWFRVHFNIDSSLSEESLTLFVQLTGAAEIYLNGKLIANYGKFSNNPEQVKAAHLPWNEFIGLPVKSAGVQVIAVRFAVQKNLLYPPIPWYRNYALLIRIMQQKEATAYLQSNINYYLDYLRAGVFLILAILHVSLFWFYRAQVANLYFFIYSIIFCITTLLASIVHTHVHTAAVNVFFNMVPWPTQQLGLLLLLTAAYKMFNYRMGVAYWIIAGWFILQEILFFSFQIKWDNFIFDLFPYSIIIDFVRITILASRAKKRGASIAGAGAIIYLIFSTLYELEGYGILPAGFNDIYAHIIFNICLLSIPVAISIYLALEESYANRTLQQKLIEVQQLSATTIAQEKEKQEILASQKEILEEQVNERTAELRQSFKELKETQAQLIQSEKMASLGQLTAGIAHEIQNPLNFVNNFSEINTELVDELKNELMANNKEEALLIADDIKENEQKIIHHGKRADRIVKGMLQHSRASSGKKELTDINALVDECIRLSYHGMRAKDKDFNATINTNFDDSIGKINIVPQDISRVLLNLFNNAFYTVNEKKMQLNGAYEPAVSVCTKKLDDKVEIQVRDNGNGIPQNIIDKIFQPFFTTKPTGQGTGLGLSLSYDILKAHGGEIKVESKEGEGSEFTIYLPC